MVTIRHDDGPCPPPVSRVNQHPAIAGFCDDALYGRRVWADDGHDPIGGDNIAKANIDQFYIQKDPPSTRAPLPLSLVIVRNPRLDVNPRRLVAKRLKPENERQKPETIDRIDEKPVI